jgi:hypothetical protein
MSVIESPESKIEKLKKKYGDKPKWFGYAKMKK